MTTMDLWYDLASRDATDLNLETLDLLHQAEEALRLAAAKQAEEDDEQHRATDDEPDRSLR